MKKILILAGLLMAGRVAQAQQVVPVYAEAKVKHSMKGEWTVVNLGVQPMPVVIEMKEVVAGQNGQPAFQPLSSDIRVELPDTSAIVPPKGQHTFSYRVSCERNCAVSFFNAMMNGKTKDGIAVRLWVPSTVWACTDSAKDCRTRSKKALGITE
jgi:hypothetical protein